MNWVEAKLNIIKFQKVSGKEMNMPITDRA